MVLIKLMLRPWSQAFWSQLFSVLAVGILLWLCGVLFWLERGLGPVLHRLQTEKIYTLYIDPELKPEAETKLLEHVTLVAERSGATVTATEAGEFIEGIRSSYPDLARQLESMNGEASAIIPRYFSVVGNLPEHAIKELKSTTGIQELESSQGRYKQILGAFESIRWIARVLGIGVLGAVLMGLVLLARSNFEIHSPVVHLMTVWGANPGVVQLPLLFSGAFVGAIGGLIAAVEWYSAGRLVVDRFRELYPVLQAMPDFSKRFCFILLLAGLGIGLLSSVLGSFRDFNQRRAAG